MVPALRPGRALNEIAADVTIPFISEQAGIAPLKAQSSHNQFASQLSISLDGAGTLKGHQLCSEGGSLVSESMCKSSSEPTRPLPAPHREGRPFLRKSQSAMSSLSLKSAGTEKSSLPSCVGVDLLRPAFGVSVTAESPIQDVFEVQEKLGEGGFGQVWLCQHRHTRQHVAIKSMDINSIRDLDRFERELKVFERLSNPYIVSLHQVFRGDSQLYLVMDLCTGGDLRKYLAGYWQDPMRAHVRKLHPKSAVGLPYGQVARYVWQMLAGIAYMHHHRFMHRDIKLANYMLKDASDSSIIQLVDFGLSTTFRKGEPLNFCCGTTIYMAPEVLRGSYTEKSDLWSIGIVAYVLCNERTPWNSNVSRDIADSILANSLAPWPTPSHLPEELTTLIDWLLTYDHLLRPIAKEVLCSSKWLRKNCGMSLPEQTCCAIS